MTQAASARELLLEQENAKLKQRVQDLMGGDALVQLPNKDLWRGAKRGVERPDNFVAEPPRKIDAAMSRILQAANGSTQLTCPWCGQQSVGEEPMREHLETLHKQLVTPRSGDEAAALAALLDEKNAELQHALDK